MVLGDNPPAFSSGSDASGDNSCSSSSGNGSDPNTPAAVSGAEDGSSNAVISSSNDSLDQIVGSNGTASGTDDNESENRLNEMAAQLAFVSLNQQDQNSPSWDSAPTMHLGDPSSSSSSSISTHIHSPAGQQLQQLLEARLHIGVAASLSHDYLECSGINRRNAFSSNQLNDQQQTTDNRGRRNRPIVSTPDNFYPPADNNPPLGLNHNLAQAPLPAENQFQNWDFGDIRLPRGDMPFTSQDADPQNSGFSVAGLFPSGGQGSSSQGFPPPTGNPLPLPQFGFSHFPPADQGGYVQGAEHQAAHESSGAQFHHNGMVPESAGGGVVAESAVGGMPDAVGNQHTSSGRGKPTFTECVDVQTSEHVAEIVGRQGCKIKELRARTQTYIRTPTREEPPIFTVTGVKEKVLLAAQEIRQMAAHFTGIRDARRPRPNNPNEVHLKMPLETGLVGLVVGTRGATIKKIQEESGAYIVTPNRNENENQISTFSIRGQPHEVKKAEALIKEHINSRITPKDGSGGGGMMHRHRTDSSHRALLPRVIQGSSPPSPDAHLAGAGAQPAPAMPINGFAAGNSVHSPPLSNSFNGIGSSSGLPAYPDSGYGAHNGCASRHSSHSGAARCTTNGFANDHGDLGRQERFGHSYFVSNVDSRTSICSLGSEMGNGFGSSSRSSSFSGLGNGVSSSSFSNTSSSGSSAGLSSSMNPGTGSTRSPDRWNGGTLVMRSSARSPDRWNGGTLLLRNPARSPDRWNGGTLVLRGGPGFGERRNGVSDSRTNGASSAAMMGEWGGSGMGSTNGRNGFTHGTLNGSMGSSSFGSPDSAGLGPGTNGGGGLRNGGPSTYNGASFNGAGYSGASYNGARRNSGSFSYTDTFGGAPFSSSTPLNPASGSHMQNGMPGSGPFDGDGLGDDWNRYTSSTNFPNPRAYGRFTTEEQYPSMPFPGTSSSNGGPSVPSLDALDVFNSSSLESLVPRTSSMNQFAPIGLVTTTSFQSDPSASMTSAFSGTVLGGSSLLQSQADLWATASGSNGHAFPETPGSKPQPDADALPVDLSEPFSYLRFPTENKRTSTTTTAENPSPEKATETQENPTEATQQKEDEEDKEEGAEKEQQKEEEDEAKSA